MQEQRIVQEGVQRTDREQRGRQIAQVGVQGGHVRIATRCGVRGVLFGAVPDVARVQEETLLADPFLAGRHGAVVVAVSKIGGPEAGVPVLVTHPHQRGNRQGGTGRFAADGEHVGAELGPGIVDQPQCGGFAILPGRGPGMGGGQPVLHAGAGHTGGADDAFQDRILIRCAAHDQAAAVQVQVDPGRLLGGNHVQADRLTACDLDGHVPRPGRDWDGERALAPRFPGLGLALHPLAQRRVESTRFRGNGFRTEQRRIDRIAVQNSGSKRHPPDRVPKQDGRLSSLAGKMLNAAAV